MTPELWQKIRIVVEEAVEITPALRPAFLDEACGADGDLRREVESLLGFNNTKGALLEQNAFSVVAENGTNGKAKNLIGKQIGKYRIIEELGVGGMGAVFLAERADGDFQQQVALKLIKRGMDSRAVLRRFVNERQILASLKHPNIAHLIDGGTTDDGSPFFVMEYVAGEDIISYAARVNLDLESRLKLFREVCAAVAFAHRNLVIHRDLKPSNILVTRDGAPKLLDFGIAKLLKTDTDDETATHSFIFTPEYASPEQVRGEKLTTATDVYSLGVILYQLLTGNRPYQTDSRSISDIIRAVCETEPARPSSVVVSQLPIAGIKTNQNDRRGTKSNERIVNLKSKIGNPKSLRGDLDNIILKALRKEPERRYSSVEQLSEDIRRHLAGLPVTAQRDTWNYRAGKFISRNRVAVVFAVMVVLALVGGVIGTTWQSIRAERMRAAAEQERLRAERRFENLRKISNSLVSEIERAIRDLPGSLPARKLLLARAIEQLDALAAESDGNTKLQLELVWAYQNLGTLPDKTLGESQKILEKAVAVTEKILAAEPSNKDARDRLAMLYLDMIYISRLRGDVNYTLEYNRRAVQIVEDIMRENPDEPGLRDSFWTVYYHYALTMQQLGKAAETVETGRKILPAAEYLYQIEPENTDNYNFMKPHLTRTAIGYGLNFAGDYAAAIHEFETALAECQAEFVKRPDADILLRNEANIRLQLATALENSNQKEAALKQAEIALAVREKMAANNPKDHNFQVALADAELFLGQMLARQNQTQTVVQRLKRALDLYEKMTAIDPERMQVKILAARTRASLGDALASKGEIAEGLRHLREAVQFFESIGAANTIDAHLKHHFADACARLAAVLMQSAERNAEKRQEIQTEARAALRQSLDLWRDLQNQGTLKHSDSAQPAEVARRLAELE